MANKPKTENPTKSVSEKFIDQFYSIQADFINEKGEKIEITDSGFLGLLATGYKGLAILRKQRNHTHAYSKFTKGKKLVKRNPGAVTKKKN
jgi:hypothetical protein